MSNFFPLTRTWPWSTSCRACDRTRPGRAPHDVVQATLEHDDQVLAVGPLGARLSEVVAELTLQQSVGALHLLLLAQLQAVARYLSPPRLPVLSRTKLRFSIAHFSVKHRSPQKQFLPFPAAQVATASRCLANSILPSQTSRTLFAA